MRKMALAALISAANLAASADPLAAQGPGCATALAEFHYVVDSDVRTGNLNPQVYSAIMPGLAQADGLCRAGREAQALQTLSLVKRQHGYH